MTRSLVNVLQPSGRWLSEREENDSWCGFGFCGRAILLAGVTWMELNKP